MKIVFIGASTFGLRCLDSCLEAADIDVVGMVTAPQTFAISYRPTGVTNVLHADMVSAAEARMIPFVVLQDSMNDPGLFDRVCAWKPDAFVVAGWYHMIPRRWRALAPAYGLHASLLPDYSGGAPLVWAMINGETRTGVTLFQMNDGVDSGPIAAQAEEAIHGDDTIASLYARIEARGVALLRHALPAMASGTLTLHEQDESRRRVFPQRSPADGQIDWTQDAASIDRFIRAQTRPYPGAFSTLDSRPMTIWAARPLGHDPIAEVGCIRRSGSDQYAVACRDGAIVLQEITWQERTYCRPELATLLGEGGQQLDSKRRAKP